VKKGVFLGGERGVQDVDFRRWPGVVYSPLRQRGRGGREGFKFRRALKNCDIVNTTNDLKCKVAG